MSCDDETYRMLADHVELFTFMRRCLPVLERLTALVAEQNLPAPGDGGPGLVDLRRALRNAEAVRNGQA